MLSGRDAHNGTVMEHDIGFLGTTLPLSVRKAEAVFGKVTDHSFHSAFRLPVAVPDPSTLSALLQSLHRFVAGLGSNETDDLGDSIASLS